MSTTNALRGALTAHASITTGHESDAREKFVRACLAELKPLRFHMKELARSIALGQWRMNRFRAIRENAGSFDAHTLACLSLCQRRLERNFQRDLKLCLELMNERPADPDPSKPIHNEMRFHELTRKLALFVRIGTSQGAPENASI